MVNTHKKTPMKGGFYNQLDMMKISNSWGLINQSTASNDVDFLKDARPAFNSLEKDGSNIVGLVGTTTINNGPQSSFLPQFGGAKPKPKPTKPKATKPKPTKPKAKPKK